MVGPDLFTLFDADTQALGTLMQIESATFLCFGALAGLATPKRSAASICCAQAVKKG